LENFLLDGIKQQNNRLLYLVITHNCHSNAVGNMATADIQKDNY